MGLLSLVLLLLPYVIFNPIPRPAMYMGKSHAPPPARYLFPVTAFGNCSVCGDREKVKLHSDAVRVPLLLLMVHEADRISWFRVPCQPVSSMA